MSAGTSIDILTAARDLVITHEEAENVVVGAFRSAVVGGLLVYMVYAFAKGIGLSKRKQEEFAEMARRV